MNYINFEHNDAWILLSIPFDENGTDLEGLIGRADGINHAIPTDDEIEGAINRSLKSGIIKYKNNNFIINNEYVNYFKKLYKNNRTIFKTWEELEKYLKNNKWKVKYPELNFKLKPSESKKAYKKYSKWFWKTYKELEQKEKNNLGNDT